MPFSARAVKKQQQQQQQQQQQKSNIFFDVDIVVKKHKKPGKIYCSTFRGHHDSIIKTLNKKHARKERYKKSINYNKRPKQTPLHGWNPFARSMLVYACEYIAFLLQGNQVCCYIS